MKDPSQSITTLLTMVHCRNQKDVIAFAEHARSSGAASGVIVECAVADNSGDWDTQLILPHWISLSQPGENVGYLAGCVERSRPGVLPRRDSYWVAVVNTDIQFAPDFFERFKVFQFPEDIGAIAPNICLPNSTQQNPHMRSRPTSLGIRARSFCFGNPFLGYTWAAAHMARARLRIWRREMVRSAGGRSSQGFGRLPIREDLCTTWTRHLPSPQLLRSRSGARLPIIHVC